MLARPSPGVPPRRIRLFNEPRDRIGAGRMSSAAPTSDVAVAGLRRGRAHAEGDETAGARSLCGDCEAFVQRARVGDRVVRGEQP